MNIIYVIPYIDLFISINEITGIFNIIKTLTLFGFTNTNISSIIKNNLKNLKKIKNCQYLFILEK